ncbi:MAG: hypothetical protein Q4E33_05125 [Erysipelotrichaceae bacterium]|nr:hypothetical protein [Erysipelotrichaceae bacterium]
MIKKNNRIVSELNSLKLPIDEIAEKIHVSKKTIQLWNKNGCKTDIDTLCNISTLTNQSTDYLLGLDDRQFLDTSGIDKQIQKELCILINKLKDH